MKTFLYLLVVSHTPTHTHTLSLSLSTDYYKLSAAVKTPPIEQSLLWKVQILLWMDRTPLGRIPLQSAPWLQSERVTACLQFRMVAGVQVVLQHPRHLTSIGSLQLVRLIVKVEQGPIRFMSSKVSQSMIYASTPGDYLLKCSRLWFA